MMNAGQQKTGWTATLKDKTDLAIRLSNLEAETASLRNDIDTIKETLEGDAMIFRPPFFMNTASQTLQFALKNQLMNPPPAYNKSVPFPIEDSKIAVLFDQVIERRNKTIHPASRKDLEEQSVTVARDFLDRCPQLRTVCQQETIVIDSLEQIMTAFGI
ncbi:hypothetical protein DFS34DRAFT_597858 [Phlyctochytrium arcticum]|nr:hypothetical protein DFS34DRAFT_597858 [Phlyctochytrium arcticum]